LAVLVALVAVGLAADENGPDLQLLGEQDGLNLDYPNGEEDPTVKYLLRDVTGKALQRLREANLGFEIKDQHPLRHDGVIETFGKKFHRGHLQLLGFDLLEMHEGEGGFQDPGYHNPEQLKTVFHKLVEDHPQEAKIFDLTSEYKQEKTVEGRSLYALKVSDNAHKDESEPNVLLVSNHHAREVMTPELALYFAKQLLEGNSKAKQLEAGELGEGDLSEEEISDAKQMKKLVDGTQTYIMWTMNPDGLNTVYTKNAWKRTNGRNIDLNRNYPVGWARSCAGTSSGGETFRGPHPFSETETKTMRAFQDNRNFAKVMDFHSYSQELRTNYGPCSHLPPKIDQKFQKMRDNFARKMGYQASRSCCMGGDIHYAYNRHGSLAYLVEAGTSFQPSAKVKDKVVKGVWPGVKAFLQQPISASGIVTDKKTGKPVAGAKMSLPDYKFTMKERFQSGPRGHYHMWLPAGKHRLKVSAPGKPTKHVTIVAKNKGSIKHIKL
jgi:predicted deacylase